MNDYDKNIRGLFLTFIGVIIIMSVLGVVATYAR